MDSLREIKNVSVCLVEPEGAGNIGSVARAMANMGLSNLILIGGVDPDCEETRQMACGSYQIIEQAKHYENLREAIAPFSMVVGTSRRVGKSRKTTHFADEFGQFAAPWLQNNNMVILFGRERSGLSTDELDLCEHRVLIPTSDIHRSLNIAQAVLIVAYEIARAVQGPTPPPERKLADSREVELMYDHFQCFLTEIGFIKADNPGWMLRAFRTIFSRSQIDSRDIRILRGMLSDSEWYLNHCLKIGHRDGERIDKPEKK